MSTAAGRARRAPALTGVRFGVQRLGTVRLAESVEGAAISGRARARVAYRLDADGRLLARVRQDTGAWLGAVEIETRSGESSVPMLLWVPRNAVRSRRQALISSAMTEEGAVHPALMRLYTEEIVRQCDSAVVSYRHLVSALERQHEMSETEFNLEVFVNAQGVLTASASVSKYLWSSTKHTQARCEALRNALGIREQ